MAQRSDLPFGSQFTPAQIDLPRLLRLVEANDGKNDDLRDAIIAAFFAGHGGDTFELGKNTVLSLIAYGVLDRDRNTTDFGRELIALVGDEPELYAALASHVLVKLRGLEVIQTILDMQQAREGINLTSLRKALEIHGIHMPKGGTHFSGMKAWMQKAGAIDDNYVVDKKRVGELIGMDMDDADALTVMHASLRGYLRALVQLAPAGPTPSNAVADYANRLYGFEYPDKSLPKTLEPLVTAGFITLTKTTTGRGAKPHLVELTDKAKSEYLDPLLDSLAKAAGVRIKFLYSKSLEDILTEVYDDDRNIKGRALESLAVYLCRLLGLEFRAWRLHGPQVSFAEVDAVLEGSRFIFSRWQVQCKNTGRVSLDDVAKEVGLTFRLKSNVVMVVSTGTVSKDARSFAVDVMQTTNLQIILLDKKDLVALMAEPTRIVDLMDREAAHAMDLKKLPDLD